jgi:hypothetical protein
MTTANRKVVYPQTKQADFLKELGIHPDAERREIKRALQEYMRFYYAERKKKRAQGLELPSDWRRMRGMLAEAYGEDNVKLRLL